MSIATEPVALDGSTFRRVLAYVPTSVVVASTRTEGVPVGMIVGTFTAISSDPPLVGFFGDTRSSTLDTLLAGNGIAFSLLSEDDEQVAEAFRLPLVERFAAFAWHDDEGGNPVPDAAVIIVSGVVQSAEPVGDHVAVVVEVTGAQVPRARAKPLVHFNHRLSKLVPDRSAHVDLWQLGWEI